MQLNGGGFAGSIKTVVATAGPKVGGGCNKFANPVHS
jgi:hypothetical protein